MMKTAMFTILFTAISTFSQTVVNVDSTNCDTTICYQMSDKTFRQATALVGTYGSLKAQVDTSEKIISTYESMVSKLNERSKLSDSRDSARVAIIASKDKQITQTKWKFGAVGGLAGFLVGVIGTLATLVAIN